MSKKSLPRLVGREDAAKILKCSTRTIDRHIRAGTLRFTFHNRKIFFCSTDLEFEAFLEPDVNRYYREKIAEIERIRKRTERNDKFTELGKKLMSDELESYEIDDIFKAITRLREEERQELKAEQCRINDFLRISESQPEEKKKPTTGMKPTRYITVDPNDPDSQEKAKIEEQGALERGERVSIHYETHYSEEGRKKLDEEQRKREEERRRVYSVEHMENKRSE
jgi:hypothetical protein